MSVAARMQARLTAALAPSRLDIIDDSARHAGHAGARPEGETHFRLLIVSDAFAGRARIDRHRLVHEILASELADRVHALSLKTLTPAEADQSLPE